MEDGEEAPHRSSILNPRSSLESLATRARPASETFLNSLKESFSTVCKTPKPAGVLLIPIASFARAKGGRSRLVPNNSGFESTRNLALLFYKGEVVIQLVFG